jgi:hypothetical protein
MLEKTCAKALIPNNKKGLCSAAHRNALALIKAKNILGPKKSKNGFYT